MLALKRGDGGVMHPELIEIMRNQACTIYRAVTGADMPTVEAADSEPEPPLEEVTRSCTDPLNFCSGVILIGETHEHLDGRRDQAMDSAA